MCNYTTRPSIIDVDRTSTLEAVSDHHPRATQAISKKDSGVASETRTTDYARGFEGQKGGLYWNTYRALIPSERTHRVRVQILRNAREHRARAGRSKDKADRRGRTVAIAKHYIIYCAWTAWSERASERTHKRIEECGQVKIR